MMTSSTRLGTAGIGVSMLLLAACGGGTGAGDAGGGGTGDDGGSEGGTTIRLVAAEYSASNTQAFWDAFAETYNDTTDHTLEVQIISWDNIDQQSSTMIQNNQAPDILNHNVFASYAADDLLYSAEEVLPQEAQDDILDTFVDSGSYDGTFYGFPDLASARALFYNEDLFEQAGVDGPPTTWEELQDAAQAVSDLGDDTIGYAMPLGPEEAQAEFSMWLFNNGGEWKQDDTWEINSPQNLESLDFMRGLSDAGVTQANPATTNRADAFDLFRSDRVGMIVGFSPLAADLDEEGSVNYGVAPFPSNDGQDSRTFGVTDYLMAFQNEGNEDAVRAFYELYYQPEQINAFIEAEGFLPVTETGLEHFADDEDLAVYLETLPTTRLTPTDDPTWDRIQRAVQQNLGSAMTEDPQSVLDQLQQTAETTG